MRTELQNEHPQLWQNLRNFLNPMNRTQMDIERHLALQNEDTVRATLILQYMAECSKDDPSWWALLPRDSDGRLPSYAWPGGYPVVYVMSDGAVLCADCANNENGSEATDDRGVQDERSGWLITGHDVHWEGGPEVCAHCNCEIESAYGVPSEGGAK